MKYLALIAALSLAACSTPVIPNIEPETMISGPPSLTEELDRKACERPVRPVYELDSISPKANILVLVTALIADRKERIAYEAALERYQDCK